MITCSLLAIPSAACWVPPGAGIDVFISTGSRLGLTSNIWAGYVEGNLFNKYYNKSDIQPNALDHKNRFINLVKKILENG